MRLLRHEGWCPYVVSLAKGRFQGGGPRPGGCSPYQGCLSPSSTSSKSPLEVGARAAMGLAGQFSDSRKVASEGNPKSLDQSMVVLSVISFMKAST
jgi:hypothetical protein